MAHHTMGTIMAMITIIPTGMIIITARGIMITTTVKIMAIPIIMNTITFIGA